MYDRPFRWWVQSVMPLVFDDSLSYYEVLAKLTKYIEALTGDVEQIKNILATIEGIEDVTQFTEFLEEIKAEIGDLANLSTQSKTNLVSAINDVALKADIAYCKPPTGIPESDLSEEVQDKLNKTGEATEYIINNRKLKAAPSNNSPADLGLGTYTVPPGGIPWDTLSTDVQNRINAGGEGGSGGTTDYSDLNNKPQIDGHTLMPGNNTHAMLGLGTYDKPDTGIPENDLSAGVREKLNANPNIAVSENSFYSTRDYEAGELVFINGVLYKIKYRTLAGTNLIPGNNIEATDISSELDEINNDIEAMQSGSGPDSWNLSTTVHSSNSLDIVDFFEYFNCIGGENYNFIVEPVDPSIADGYTLNICERDGSIVKTVIATTNIDYANRLRFTFRPTNSGEYFCKFHRYANETNVSAYKVTIEYTQSQGISELWNQVNKATQVEPRVTAVETLVGDQQEEIEKLINDTTEKQYGVAYFDIMGVGNVSGNGRTFYVDKNKVYTIKTANSTARKIINIFGTIGMLATNSFDTADLSEQVFYDLNYAAEKYDLRIHMAWKNKNSSTKNMLCVASKNRDTNEISKGYVFSDSAAKYRTRSLFEVLPAIKENGNFALFYYNADTNYVNELTYFIEVVPVKDAAYDVLKTENLFNPKLRGQQYIKGSNPGGGTPANDVGFCRTEKLVIGYSGKLTINLKDPTYEYYVSYYGENGALDGTDYLGYSSYVRGSFTVPETAKIIGISFRRADLADLTLADYTRISDALYFESLTDSSLTLEGKSADAYATGKAISKNNFYYSNDEIALIDTTAGVIAKYDELCYKYPDYITKVVRTSDDFTNYEYILTIGNYNSQNGHRGQDAEIAKPTVLIVAGVHGEERSSVMGLYGFVKDMCENKYALNKVINCATFKIIPVVCPWGYDNNSRTNENGVNINRNFNTNNWRLLPSGGDYSGPTPASEPETKLVQDWIDENENGCLYIDWHNSGYSNEISCFLGLQTDAAKRWKKEYLTAINNVIPWWMKGRGLSTSYIYAYTGSPTSSYSNTGTSVTYGREHGIETSFTLETSVNVLGGVRHTKFTIGVGQEAFGNMLIGFTKIINELI